MKNSVMLGSISYPEFSGKKAFLQNLESIESTIKNLDYDCTQVTTSWQNLDTAKGSIQTVVKSIFLHCWFETEIYNGKNKPWYFVKNLLKTCARVIKDLAGLTSEEFHKKHIRDQSRIKYITDKHLRIIGHFLDSDSEYLLVCEDDIVLDTNPEVYLQEVLQIAELHQHPLFITICNNSVYSKVSNHFGGRIENYPGGASNFWVKIDFFVNGCAMYFLNREMAALINDFVVQRPIYRKCAIDWLLSLIGRKFDSKDTTCLIPRENYVGNGSREKTME